MYTGSLLYLYDIIILSSNYHFVASAEIVSWLLG